MSNNRWFMLGYSKYNKSFLILVLVTVFVMVGASTTLGAYSKHPADASHRVKIVILGNSIAFHPDKPEIGWIGKWGMAASTRENDYAHQVAKFVAGCSNGRKVDLIAKNIADFEKGFEKTDFSAYQNLIKHADIVIVQLGENVNDEDALTRSFGIYYEKMISTIKSSNVSVIICVGSWWPGKYRYNVVREVARRQGVLFADISGLHEDNSNRALSERSFINDGVADHPGDKGMKSIAAIITEVLKSQPQYKSCF